MVTTSQPLDNFCRTMGIFLHGMTENSWRYLPCVETKLLLNPTLASGTCTSGGHHLQLHQVLPALSHHAPFVGEGGVLPPLELDKLMVDHLKIEGLIIIDMLNVFNGNEET